MRLPSNVIAILGIAISCSYQLKEQDFFVDNFPGQPFIEGQTRPVQFAGVLPTTLRKDDDTTKREDKSHGNKDEKHLFFWLIESELQLLPRKKLVIWLNGGPGCSSLDGLLLEAGPFRAQMDGSFKTQEYTWTKNAHMLFVDQPVNTGYSDVHTQDLTLDEMRNDFKGFMDTFFSVFPRYHQFDIYMAGESFSGTMIPYYALAVNFDLTGLILFTPWFDSINQYFNAKKMGLRYNLITDVKEIEEQENLCHARIAKDGNKAGFSECEEIFFKIRKQSQAGGKQCFNVYDVTIRDRTHKDGCGAHWPYELDKLPQVLAKKEVKEALHVENQQDWGECRKSKLDQSKIDAGIMHLPELLEKMSILVLGGDHDFVCNVDGIEKSLHSLTWGGHSGFGADNEEKKIWVDDQPIGTLLKSRNLTFVRLYNSSHMVPYDRPKESLAVVNQFLYVDTPGEPLSEDSGKEEARKQREMDLPELLLPLDAEAREERAKQSVPTTTTTKIHHESVTSHSLKYAMIGLFFLVTAGVAWQRRREIISRVWRKSGPGWYSLDEMRLPS